MFPILEGLGFHFLLCLLTLLAGMGFLCLWNIQTERRFLLFLAPIVTLSLWAIILGIGIILGYPVKHLWKFILPFTIILVILSQRNPDLRIRPDEWPLIAFVIIQPLLLMFFYFGYGIKSYLGSPLPDGWSYIAFGQYLWEFPKGTEGGLDPLYQYAAHLSQTRFIGSGMMGLFSLVTGSPGDTQASSGYFLSWTLFVFASSCQFFGMTHDLKRGYLLLFVSLCVFSGWMVNLLWANNYDNALAVSFLPAFAGAANLVDPKKTRWIFVIALLMAGVLYSYPEMAPPILAGVFLFCLKKFVSQRNILAWFVFLVGVIILSLFFILPFIHTLSNFFQGQIRISLNNVNARPGEGMFSELLNMKYALSAFWGFSPSPLIGNLFQHLLALFLYVTAGLGIGVLAKKKEWGLLSALFLFILCSAVMLFHLRYSYGAYKFQLLNWWLLSFCVVLGTIYLFSHLRWQVCRWGILTFLILLFAATGNRVYLTSKKMEHHSVLPFKEVLKAKDITKGQPILVALENDRANEWAVYYLRNHPIQLTNYKVYMAQPHVVPFMEKSKPISISEIHYLLTDERGVGYFSAAIPPRPIWRGGLYYLWEIEGPWILIKEINNPNGLENWGGQRGFWLDQNATKIILLSIFQGQLVIQADFIPGPSLPNRMEREILIETDGGYRQVSMVRNERKRFIIPVRVGENQIRLRALDNPSVQRLPNGDTRILMLGVRGLEMSVQVLQSK